MRTIPTLYRLTGILLLFVASTPLFAASSLATVNAKVIRHLTMTNTSEMNFGVVSINSSAGAVVLSTDGRRESTGGARINGSGTYSLAKFIIEGSRNADYSITFSQEIEMTDGHGNTLIIDQIDSKLVDVGESDGKGLRELVVGARLNLEAYQATGAYQGSLIVEVEYR